MGDNPSWMNTNHYDNYTFEITATTPGTNQSMACYDNWWQYATVIFFTLKAYLVWEPSVML